METVTHIEVASADSPSYTAQIQCTSAVNKDDVRTKPLLKEDLDRVSDFNYIAVPPPSTAKLRVCDLSKEEFVACDCRLRGGYIFYVKENSGIEITEEENVVGVPCIPLYQCTVEFPPGGRRMFREHVNFKGSKGYEFAIRAKQDGTPEQTLAYIVGDKLSIREEWSNAIKHRSEVKRETQVRIMVASQKEKLKSASMMYGDSMADDEVQYFSSNSHSRRIALTQTVMNDSLQDKNQELLGNALKDFLSDNNKTFNEEDWVYSFFRDHDEFDSENTVALLESYLKEVRRSIRSSILEQYENFVDASKELTIMGKEVAKTRDSWKRHVEDITVLKDSIKFQEAFRSLLDNEDDQDDVSDDSSARPTKVFTTSLFLDSDDSSMGSSDDSLEDTRILRNKPVKSTLPTPSEEKETDKTTHVQLPPHLSASIETYSNLSSLQCRYTEASNVGFKVKAEIENLLSQDERLTENKFSNKQITTLLRMQQNIEEISSKMCKHLVENLRRKNEALRQTLKRDRSSIPLSELMLLPLVSPTCLGDDIPLLNILVKHGRSQEAAKQYAARRTLLLNECLNERSISGTGIMDLVINAAQLSQNFFACLSTSVEGFLDLFLDPPNSLDEKEEYNQSNNTGMPSASTQPGEENNTIVTNEIMNKIPAGALSSIVYWCDVELIKFSNHFCGSKLLGSLALSTSTSVSVKTPKLSKDSIDKHKPSPRDDPQKAIEVAAKCIDKVFELASENLDSIGLPLSPKLAVYICPHLKGCEAQVAHLLNDKWNHIIYPWFETEDTSTMLDDDSVDNAVQDGPEI